MAYSKKFVVSIVLAVFAALGIGLLAHALLDLNRPLDPLKHFVRISKNREQQPVSLDVALSTYELVGGQTVTLVGAVHLADAKHYQRLNKELSKFSTVLYELVAPDGTKPIPRDQMPKDMKPSGLSQLQYSLGDLLDTRFQLDEVDYTPKSFVHADLSLEDLAREMREKGESPFTLLLGILKEVFTMGADPKMQELSQNLSFTSLFLNPKSFKMALAQALASSDHEDGIPGLTAIAPFLIDARNIAALEVLSSQLKNGGDHIAIYYGAAHMPDFEQRLMKDFGAERKETYWLVAWDLTRDLPSRSPFELLGALF